MENKELIPGLGSLIGESFARWGFELVELKCRCEGRNVVVGILADRPQGGITVDECMMLNRRIGDLIEERDLIPSSYILEVNSPGLDRPLACQKDFCRCAGRKVKFFLILPINGKIEIDGVITKVSEEGVETQTEQGVCVLPLSNIQKAKQIF